MKSREELPNNLSPPPPAPLLFYNNIFQKSHETKKKVAKKFQFCLQNAKVTSFIAEKGHFFFDTCKHMQNFIFFLLLLLYFCSEFQ